MIDKKDLIIMGIMTAIYTVIALINLGSLSVPTSEWTPTNIGESFQVDLHKTTKLARISYYEGLQTTYDPQGTYKVEYKDADGSYKPLGTIEKREIFCWKYIDVNNIKTNMLRFTVEIPGGTLTELGFFKSGSKEPLEGVTLVKDKMTSPNAEHLLDEQNKITYKPSYWTDTYFDEIYHARTAYENIHHIEPYENTHPPLGKIFISFGIMIFGMVPFGWRLPGTVFGILMVPLMYLFGKQLFDKHFYAFLSAFLMMFDFMHFTQTRIATIDSFVTFFTILMFYFMNWFFKNNAKTLSLKGSILPLLLCGFAFGLGAASKWIALYGAAGLALMLLWSRIERIVFENKVASKIKIGIKPMLCVITKNIVTFYLIGGSFIIILPLILYILSYIPIMQVPGPGHSITDIVTYQINMYKYHEGLKATHIFSSPWYEWPFIIRPMWYYHGIDIKFGFSSTIVALGNPAIWWVGTVCFFIAAAFALSKRDKSVVVIFIAITSQYLPWVLIPRITFIYHFFSCVPFIILAIVYTLKCIMEYAEKIKWKYSVHFDSNKNKSKAKNVKSVFVFTPTRAINYLTYLYMFVVVGLFIWFYPALSGLVVPTKWIDSLKWFSSWFF